MKNSIKKFLASIGFVLMVFPICAQPVDFKWVKEIKGSSLVTLGSVAVDDSGNVYIVGEFSTNVDVDPGPGVMQFVSAGCNDTYLSKLNSNGDLLWAWQITGASCIGGAFIEVDTDRVYIAGIFDSTVDFDPGPGVYTLTSAGSFDGFVAGFDLSGHFLWANRTGGASEDFVGGLASHRGYVYVTGHYFGLADYEDFNHGYQGFYSYGESDIFLCQLSKYGDLVWARQFGSENEDHTGSVAVDDSGYVYTSGGFLGLMGFTESIIDLTTQLSSTGLRDIFIAKHNLQGDLIWTRRIGGDLYNIAPGITTDAQGDIYVTGGYFGTTDFDPGPSLVNLTSAGNYDAFICKLSKAGNYLWVSGSGGAKQETGRSVCTDKHGNVFATGYFESTIGFGVFNGNTRGNPNFLTDLDAFFVQFTDSGQPVWGMALGGPSLDYGLSVVANSLGDVYAAGTFSDTAEARPPLFPDLIAIGSESDGFLLKFSSCVETITEDSIMTCSPYTSPSGNHIYTLSGLYYDTLQTTNGCDSIIKIHLTITNSVTGARANSICAGDSLYVGGAWQRIGGVYFDTLVSGACDSVLTTVLTVNAIDTTLIQTTTNDSTLIGVFNTTFPNPMGCDSIVITTVVYQSGPCAVSDTVTTMSTTCDSALADTVIQVFAGSDGCDSIFISIITFDPGSLTLLADKEICEGDSSLIFGHYQSVAGTYRDTIQNKNGCDSILECGLVVKPVYSVTIMDSICAGDSLLVGGAWQTIAGSYIDVFAASNGCDSTVMTLLTILSDPACGTDTGAQGCLTVVSNNTWMQSTVVGFSNLSGFWPGSPGLPGTGTFTDPVTMGQPYNYPSIQVIENSQVISTGPSVTYFRKEFMLTHANDLDVRLLITADDQAEIFLNGQQAALISTFGRPNYKFPAHDVKFGSGVVSNGFMGGDAYDVTGTAATVGGVLQVGVNEVIVAVRNLGKPSDIGGFSFRMDINCADNIVTKKGSSFGITDLGLLVYPNPAKDIVNVDSELAINSVRLFDFTGKLVLARTYDSEKAVEIDLEELPKGVYIVEVEEIGYQVTTVKIVKQ